MSGPRPSTRAFLHDLQCLPVDTKVRFLGCVRRYNVSLGHLILEHNYPRNRSESSTVSVDVNAILEDLTGEVLRVGSWVNVLGYVRDSTSPALSFSSSQLDSEQLHGTLNATIPATVPSRPVHIDAVMVFLAGAIALGEYERILRNSQDVERRLYPGNGSASERLYY